MDESLLTREQSDYIKGILILLIVLGHNSVLMHIKSEDVWLKSWLYSFHVRCFLFLPFLYNFREFTISRVKKNARRLFVPYTIFFIILLTINSYSTHSFDFVNTVWACFTGSQSLLRDAIGLKYIWFLPTMFSILTFKDLSYTNKTIKLSLIIIGVICIALQILYLISQDIDENIPFGIYLAIFNFPIAVGLRWYLEHTEKIEHNLMCFIFFAALLTAIWFMLHPQKYIWSLFMYVLLPISIFPVIFYWSKLSNAKSKFTRIIIFFGKLSMGIYLVHQIIFNILVKVTSCIIDNRLICGLSLYFFTLGITILILLVIKRFLPRIYNFIF